jgi:hypothetical protein
MKNLNASDSKLVLDYYGTPNEKLPKVELQEKLVCWKTTVLRKDKKKVFGLESS